ncbi:hypothetical protein BCR39DRAFT_587480 [Naematelia encephala]|uniref:Uncharacterized protein n=1 Tax=Naematelia encephala TaxID=71784 RepID=A0A1Y2BA36_9TREE|nr:hypothetical protein BCR39DRAFT_587480 [Naematelia encephala]
MYQLQNASADNYTCRNPEHTQVPQGQDYPGPEILVFAVTPHHTLNSVAAKGRRRTGPQKTSRHPRRLELGQTVDNRDRPPGLHVIATTFGPTRVCFGTSVCAPGGSLVSDLSYQEGVSIFGRRDGIENLSETVVSGARMPGETIDSIEECEIDMTEYSEVRIYTLGSPVHLCTLNKGSESRGEESTGPESTGPECTSPHIQSLADKNAMDPFWSPDQQITYGLPSGLTSGPSDGERETSDPSAWNPTVPVVDRFDSAEINTSPVPTSTEGLWQRSPEQMTGIEISGVEDPGIGNSFFQQSNTYLSYEDLQASFSGIGTGSGDYSGDTVGLITHSVEERGLPIYRVADTADCTIVRFPSSTGPGLTFNHPHGVSIEAIGNNVGFTCHSVPVSAQGEEITEDSDAYSNAQPILGVKFVMNTLEEGSSLVRLRSRQDPKNKYRVATFNGRSSCVPDEPLGIEGTSALQGAYDFTTNDRYGNVADNETRP